jgi:hypothetical protein
MQEFEESPLDCSPEEDIPAAMFKGKRRSKTDPEGRRFQCGCGKTYLSYPALYTHIKNKHGGDQPNGTNVPTGKGGRGRPRKYPEGGLRISGPSSYLREKGFFGGPSDPLSG